METLKTCIISRYDETITEAPFLTIPIRKVQVPEPELDNEENYLGKEFAARLKASCRMYGYTFKFYTMSSEENIDYELVVE
jgi:hypothetical protein